VNTFRTILLLFSLALGLNAADTWHLTAGGSYAVPVGDLAIWFKPDLGLTLGLGRQQANGWQVEGRIEADRFTRENLDGYAAEAVSLELEHIGLMINGRRRLAGSEKLGFYLNLGAGPHYWKGVRSAVAADSSIDLPAIGERVLEEGNWAARTGLGLEWRPNPSLGIETSLDYRLVIGSLWPTMQQHIELEAVSGFSTVNAALRIRYYFRGF